MEKIVLKASVVDLASVLFDYNILYHLKIKKKSMTSDKRRKREHNYFSSEDLLRSTLL